jgi:hypothetical protein
MKNYLVTIKVNDPYPKEFQEKTQGNNPGLASYRAFKRVKNDKSNHTK